MQETTRKFDCPQWMIQYKKARDSGLVKTLNTVRVSRVLKCTKEIVGYLKTHTLINCQKLENSNIN